MVSLDSFLVLLFSCFSSFVSGCVWFVRCVTYDNCGFITGSRPVHWEESSDMMCIMNWGYGSVYCDIL